MMVLSGCFHHSSHPPFIYLFYFLTLQYCIGFAMYQHESTTGIQVFPILNPPPSTMKKKIVDMKTGICMPSLRHG